MKIILPTSRKCKPLGGTLVDGHHKLLLPGLPRRQLHVVLMGKTSLEKSSGTAQTSGSIQQALLQHPRPHLECSQSQVRRHQLRQTLRDLALPFTSNVVEQGGLVTRAASLAATARCRANGITSVCQAANLLPALCSQLQVPFRVHHHLLRLRQFRCPVPHPPQAPFRQQQAAAAR